MPKKLARHGKGKKHTNDDGYKRMTIAITGELYRRMVWYEAEYGAVNWSGLAREAFRKKVDQ